MTALIPSKFCGYYFIDNLTNKKIKITKKNANIFEKKATLLQKSLPKQQITFLDLAIYLKKSISILEISALILITLATTILGLLTPKMIKIIFSTIVKMKNLKLLTLSGIFLITVTLSKHLFQIVKNTITQKIVTKLTLQVESAITLRVFFMPISFFKKLSASEIFTRINLCKNFFQNTVNSIMQTWLTCVFSLSYFFQIFSYSKNLVLPTALIITSTLALCIISTIERCKFGVKRMNFLAKEQNTCIELISGIEKIKLNGLEIQSFHNWKSAYDKFAQINYNPPIAIKFNTLGLHTVKLTGILLLSSLAAIKQIQPSNFFAFYIAYESISATFFNLCKTSLELAKIKPIGKIMEPIFKTIPESNQNKKNINQISGKIEICNLSFSYEKTQKLVLNNVSVTIQPNEIVAIVGATGSGKSTLMRLLIGFETPTKGTIFYNGNNINLISLQNLRKKIAIIMQNDKLFNGNIFLNIAAIKKNISLKQAWRAAKMAQLDYDISQMPMKMNTLITREGNEFSNSQVQKILIARAIAAKPKILILDETISQLEINVQKKIIKSIKQLKCTKLIVCHKISTIKCCDRILVFKNGKIVEDGTLNELIKAKGELFNLTHN